VPDELAALATAYVLIMAVFGPLAARYVEVLMNLVSGKVGASTET
jgi:CPA2 family monovalent cation:H+ antiporter-2